MQVKGSFLESNSLDTTDLILNGSFYDDANKNLGEVGNIENLAEVMILFELVRFDGNLPRGIFSVLKVSDGSSPSSDQHIFSGSGSFYVLNNQLHLTGSFVGQAF